MIASLRGKITARTVNRVILDVGGVGYDVIVSLSTLESLPQDGEVFFHVRTLMRENALELYGFISLTEKGLFELLLGVSGIGPRLAMTILSGISPERFRKAVLQGDVTGLTAVPGIGKKSAQRILVDLKEKIQVLPVGDPVLGLSDAPGSMEDDLVSTLINLGYKEKDARPVASRVVNMGGEELTISRAVKAALRELTR
ncbi:MAG: Holliday junction branch migration protein RuvA [Pseudomonadota bacterium]